MSGVQDIIDLFSSLALQLNSTSPVDQQAIDLSISDLNRSLNPRGGDSPSSPPRVRVLDTVLSLMCFKAPQVYDLRVEYLVRTIVSVLSASVGCKALRVRNRNVLQIGSSISRSGCFNLLESLDDLIPKLEDRRIDFFNLLYACIRVVALSGCFQHGFTKIPTANLKSVAGLSAVLSRLIQYVPDKVLYQDQGRQLRLLIWYLDPLLLKKDLLQILRDVKERPFLCLSDEFRQRSDWHSLLKCLAHCPPMFIETRTLLHIWLLTTGSSSVLKLQTHLLATLLDVIMRPTCWGMSMDAGCKLPFLHAYFPSNIHLLRLLAGSLSLDSLASLGHIIEKEISQGKRFAEVEVKKSQTTAAKFANIRHHSKWAIAINFQNWFLFAASLLFCDLTSGHSLRPKDTLQIVLSKQVICAELSSSVTASYIAWILCPMNEHLQTKLKNCLIKISGSVIEHYLVEVPDQDREGHKKKLKRLKSKAKGSSPRLNIGQWVEEFQDTFSNSHSFCFQESSLLRSIPLGLLLAFPNHLNDDECELLLHYGATGRIFSSRDVTCAGRHYISSEKLKTEEAISGACLVFDLTDAVESISASVFETDEEAQGFIHLLKKRAEKYLLKCIRTLVEAGLGGNGRPQMLMDLHNRVMQWRHHGEELPFESQDLDEAASALKEKVVHMPCGYELPVTYTLLHSDPDIFH